MKIIAIINQKGGVSKSTTAHALGMGLTQRNYKVLYIDLDAQGNLSFTMDADNTGIVKSNSFNLLTKKITAEHAIQKTKQGNIIASSPELAGSDTIVIETGKEYRLKEALEPIQANYDYIIIDTPPALGILTVNALTACTGCIIPAQADIYSLQGISQLYNTIKTIKKYCNPNLEIMGILLTRYNKRSVISREFSEMLKTTANQFQTKLYKVKIRECTALKECQAMKQSIFSYAPKSNAASDYNALINEIIGAEF